MYSHWLSNDATATTADLFLMAVLTMLLGIYSCDNVWTAVCGNKFTELGDYDPRKKCYKRVTRYV